MTDRENGFKIDLHTHSTASRDGSITATQYADVLESKTLDCIAVTDHDTVDFALKLQKILGQDKIIVGEEISTTDGDIIGLFLNKNIDSGMSVVSTVEAIRKQGGLVYVPHPFETVRKGITLQALESIKEQVDIIEINNGRAFFQNYGKQAKDWAKANTIISMASSSDAHRVSGLGKTYTAVDRVGPLTPDTLKKALLLAGHTYKKPSLLDVMGPKMNKLSTILRSRRR